MHKSIATIDSPEFINLQPLDINPLMSKCEIKVLYLGENRNHSFITKEVALEMSKTLRGAPIVGYYKEENEDFADHGQRMIMDDEGIKFECLTKPYGFVAPDAKVWFQDFEDFDDFGNSTIHTYLMTTGFLWTGQFEECQSVVAGGKPQSMELDEKTLDGSWSTNTKTNVDFFIINDATFSKLCILGDSTEPCFEGARITEPDASTKFQLDKDFSNTLFNMMQDLKNFAYKGGNEMENSETKVDVTEASVDLEAEKAEEIPAEETVETAIEEEEEIAASEEEPAEPEEVVEETPADFAKAKDEEEKKDEKDKAEEDKDEDKEDEEDKDKKKKTYSLEEYSALEAELSNLQNLNASLAERVSELEASCNKLEAYKSSIEDKEKDELIQKFSMLSDEEKKDIVDNKSKYSYDDIEAKLSVLFMRKSNVLNEKEEKDVSSKFSLIIEEKEDQSAPWIQAVMNHAN